MKSHGSDWHPQKKRKLGHTKMPGIHTHKEQTVMMQQDCDHLQAKKKGLRRNQECPHWSWASSLQIYEKMHFCCLKHQCMVSCYDSPRKLIHNTSGNQYSLQQLKVTVSVIWVNPSDWAGFNKKVRVNWQTFATQFLRNSIFMRKENMENSSLC